jgi:hypothetical protein
VEASLSHGEDVEAAVRVPPRSADGGRGPDGGELAAQGSDLSTLAQEHHAEGLITLQAAVDHEAVASLEDVQREGHAGAQDGAQREERDPVHDDIMHIMAAWPWIAWGHTWTGDDRSGRRAGPGGHPVRRG